MADLQPVIFPPNAPITVIQLHEQELILIQQPGDTTVLLPPAEGFTLVTEVKGIQGLPPTAFYDFGITINVLPSIVAPPFRLLPVRDFTLRAGLPLSRFEARTPATNTAVFSLLKNGVSVGTLTFAPGDSTPSVSFPSDQDLAPPSDSFELDPPSPKDPTLAGVDLFFAGIRANG